LLPDLPGGFYSYSVIASIALCVALLYNYFRLDGAGLSFGVYSLYCAACAVCAVCVAKIIYGISYLPIAGFSLYNFLHYTLYGGIVFYGGLFGVIIGILLMSHLLRKNGKFMLDYFSISFPLFHAIARFGCLLGGCCYGIPWSWGVVMVESPDVVRFPVQIAESICNIGIFIYLTLRSKRNHSCEGTFKAYMFLYACCRFLLEFLRGDEDRGIWFGALSTSQIIALFILLIIAAKAIKEKRTRQDVF